MLPGLRILQPRASGGKVGHGLAHRLGTAVDSGCHSSLPLNHCVCMPCWDTPFGRALGKKWGALPLCPSSLASLFSAPMPAAFWEQEHKGVLEGGVGRGGWGEGGGRGSQSHTEGAQGGPDSRSVTVHFLWGGGSLLGPLWPPPSYSPSSSPPPSRPTPFLGQVGQSTWKQAGLQTPGLPHLPPNHHTPLFQGG